MEGAVAGTDGLQSLTTELHVFFLAPAAAGSARARALREVLCASEISRSERFVRDGDRQQYVAAHGLLRHVLAAYAAVSPVDLRFVANRWGRPEITGPAPAIPLRFSLSHTSGLVACAVGLGCECGVDVESHSRAGDPSPIARRVLAAAELDALEARPTEDRLPRFLAYWTLKEAYAKARGLGLRLPLREIAFALDGDAIRLESREVGAPEGEHWQFASLRPTAGHTLAVAVQRPGGPPRTLRVREGLPG